MDETIEQWITDLDFDAIRETLREMGHKDIGKTREINILVKENKDLCARIAELERERDEARAQLAFCREALDGLRRATVNHGQEE